MSGSKLAFLLALVLPLAACMAPEDEVRIEASNDSDQTAVISSGSYYDTVEAGEFWSWSTSREKVSRVWVVETDREVAERDFSEGYDRVIIEIRSDGSVILR